MSRKLTHSSFPFEDPVVVIRVTGKILLEALENGVCKHPALDGMSAFALMNLSADDILQADFHRFPTSYSPLTHQEKRTIE